jgi:hypothetical protein
MRGFISKIFDWIEGPTEDASVSNLLAGLLLFIIAGFLWHTVVKGMVEG